MAAADGDTIVSTDWGDEGILVSGYDSGLVGLAMTDSGGGWHNRLV
jgi:hypothetical protein